MFPLLALDVLVPPTSNPLPVMATKKTIKKAPPAVHVAAAPDAAPVAQKAVKTVKKTAAKKSVPKSAAKPSPDVIARAAYLNYRRRIEQGLPGDSHADWLEAERYFSGKNES